ncbi:LOW QUALITY PROTEIN: ADP-ribosylation factor-like protein 4D [Aulostomus maculatus]
MGNQLTPSTPLLPGLWSMRVVVVRTGTSLLYRLKLEEFVETNPTQGFNTDRIKVAVGASYAATFQVWDVGWQEKLRPLWKSYARRTDVLVFVVDLEVERMEEAKVELHKTRSSSEDQGVLVLILANGDTALPVGQVEKLLAGHELSVFTLHHVQRCSAVDGQGLQQGLEKFYDMILKRKTPKLSSSRRR